MDELLQVSVPKKTRIERDLAPDLPPIVGDATQLRQIVLNLVINAAEAMDGGGSVRISTCLRRCSAADLVSEYVSEAPPGGDYVLLEVSDAGPGMSEEVRRQLFDPFFTTKFSGRGLGLAAVLGIARGHRGTVQVVSEPGRGSSFRLFLPVADATPAETPDAPPEAPWTGRGRVLLVDDEASVREVSAAMLAHLGFEVTVAEGGRSALELFSCAADDFALVIVDLTMPDFSGVEVVRELLRIRPATPVLVASGYSAEEGAALLEREGVRGFLAKPYSLEELRRRIRAALPPEAGR
jgi:CheY-like chemotaxis protein